jgi:hypothetical protein
MANQKDYTARVIIDTSGAIDNIKGVSSAFNQLNQSTQTTNQRLVELQKTMRLMNPNTKAWQDAAKEYKNLGGNVKALNGGLKDLQKTLASTDPNTAEWQELNDTYLALGGTIEDLNNEKLAVLKEQLETLAPDSEQYSKVAEEFQKLGGTLPTEQAKTFKQQIRELEVLLTSGRVQEGTAEYEALRLKLTELKDAQADFKEEIAASTGSVMEQASGNVGLLGDRIMNLDFEGVSQAMKGLTGSVKNFSPKAVVDGFKAMGTSFKAFGQALMSNPYILGLTALVLGITAVVMAFQQADEDARAKTDQKMKQLEADDKIRQLTMRKEVAMAGDNQKKIYAIKMQAKLDDIKSNNERIKELEDQERRGVEMTSEQWTEYNNLKMKSSELWADKEIMEIERVQARNNMLLDVQRKYNQIGMSEREIAFDNLKNAWEDQKKKLEDAGVGFEDIKKAEATYQNDVSKMRQGFNKQDAAESKSRNDQRRQQREQNKKQEMDDAKELADLKRQIQQEAVAEEEDLDERIRKSKMTKRQLEEEAIRDEYFDLIERAKQFNLDYEALEKERDKKIAELDKEANDKKIADAKELRDTLSQMAQERIAEEEDYFQKGQDAGKTEHQLKLQQLDEQYFEEKAMMEQYQIDTTELTKKYEREKTMIEMEERQRRVDQQVEWATNSIGLLTALSELGEQKTEEGRKKAFKRNKALQIAQAVADTYASATKAYGSQLVVGDVTSPVRASIASGIAVATGLANIAKIAKTQYEGGNTSTPSASGGGGGGSMAMSSGITNSSTPQLNPLVTDFVKNRPDQITPAYVLAGDVASATEVREKVQNLARVK